MSELGRVLRLDARRAALLIAVPLIDVVLLALLDDLVKGGAGVLESILDLGPLPASRGGLFERGCALFRGKGRKSHAYVTSDVELSDTDR